MRRAPRTPFATVILAACLSLAPTAQAAPHEAELRSAFTRFVSAQNAHDAKAVGDLLVDSPDFLWITRGQPVWGREAALARFAELYRGVWRLEPDTTAFRVVFAHEGVAEIFVPVTFTIGAPGTEPQRTPFLMNQVWRHEHGAWRLASLLPIPAPPAAQAPAAR